MEIPGNLEEDLHTGWTYSHPKPGEDLVISGISGSFPQSDNINIFSDNLSKKLDLITPADQRWTVKNPEIPERIGIMKNLAKADAAFFGLSYKQVNCMDPMSRMLLEKSIEAVIDAGLSPVELKGTRTGVFIGVCISETEEVWFYEKIHNQGLGLLGCLRSMFAHRISYWLGLTGPSHTVDTACSSSMYALDLAYKSLREGNCETAIVGGCNLCLHPNVSLQFARYFVSITLIAKFGMSLLHNRRMTDIYFTSLKFSGFF